MSCAVHEDPLVQARGDLALIEAINDSRLVPVYVDDQAKFTLIHVKQRHYSSVYTKKRRFLIQGYREKGFNEMVLRLKQKYLANLRQIDANQLELFNFLQKHRALYDHLYLEGLDFGNFYHRRSSKRVLDRTRQEVSELLGDLNPIIEPAYYAGAALQLYLREGVSVYGCEEESLLKATLKAYQRQTHEVPGFLDYCHNLREDAIIINLLKKGEHDPRNKNSLRFVICGGAHSFHDNIIEWNKANPDSKMNLYEFTPQ